MSSMLPKLHVCHPQEGRLYVNKYHTRHRASTSMYSLTFCIRVMLPERHQWKPAVQAAAVMLRTPPSTASRRPASYVHFPHIVRNFENASLLPACHQPAAHAHLTERSYYVVISWDGRKLVTRVRIMLP